MLVVKCALARLRRVEQLPRPRKLPSLPIGKVRRADLARRPPKARGFAETQAPFGIATAFAEIYAAYGYRCAFTGTDLSAASIIEPAGHLLRLDGNEPTLANALPASLDAIFAYQHGHLAIGPSLEFLVALDVISPEFLATLNPLGRLSLPVSDAGPDPSLFTPHRNAFAAGLIPPH